MRIQIISVAPLAGAWIEIVESAARTEGRHVAPLAGAWIEIILVRGVGALEPVAPLAGAWIEMSFLWIPPLPNERRAPRGRVD